MAKKTIKPRPVMLQEVKVTATPIKKIKVQEETVRLYPRGETIKKRTVDSLKSVGMGRMIDLPKGYPMYCKDLKQTLDEKSKYWIGKSTLERTKRMGVDITKDIIDLKLHPNYPKQENEHSAIDDAKWNMELFNFLNKI